MSDQESVNDGRAFIRNWIANLSPEQREALDANLRECLPKLKEIEAARRAQRNANSDDPPPAGFDRVLSSIDEIEDFECLAHVAGIDPENLTAGDVVAIALEWVRQQEAGIDCEQVMPSIRELRSKPSRQAALDNLREDAMMNHVDIAVALDLPSEPLRRRLDRWRMDNAAGWQEISSPPANEPEFIYQIGAIRPVLMEAIVASYRPPKNPDS